MRDIMSSFRYSPLTIPVIIIFLGSLLPFFGSPFLINPSNLGKRLGFLVVGAGTFGWCIINSILFVLYAPRGPKPAEIEGLNAFEIRILPLTFLAGSTILFVMFVLALNRYEQEKTEAENTTD